MKGHSLLDYNQILCSCKYLGCLKWGPMLLWLGEVAVVGHPALCTFFGIDQVRGMALKSCLERFLLSHFLCRRLFVESRDEPIRYLP